MTLAAAIINNKSLEPSSDFYNSTVNICKLNQGLVGNYLVQIYMTDIFKYSNISSHCPFKKGSYLQ